MVGDILYSPGISFKNPPVTRTSAPVRTRPWFFQETALGPLSAVNKVSKANLANSKVLRPYQAVWNRSVRAKQAEELGAYFSDVPTAQQLGLGEAPATSVTTTTNRDPLGFLTNLVSTVENAGSSVLTSMQRREDEKTQTAMATVKAYTDQMLQATTSGNTPFYLIGGIAALGLLGWYLTHRR